MAVERSLGWATGKMSDQMTGKRKSIKQAKSEVSLIKAALFPRCLFDTRITLCAPFFSKCIFFQMCIFFLMYIYVRVHM